ncbi:MAG: hypothetical protein ACRDZ9_01790 [Acidimicrobiales bacterium]
MTAGAAPAATDAEALADAAATDGLLRCWTRETGLTPPPPGQRPRIPLGTLGVTVVTEVLHRSAAGVHHFGPPSCRAPMACPVRPSTR